VTTHRLAHDPGADEADPGFARLGLRNWHGFSPRRTLRFVGGRRLS
jgi:hypothetical protein